MSRPLPPALTGTDFRLDAILDELQGLRADLERAPVGVRQRVDRIIDGASALHDDPADGETVELRGVEDAPPAKPAKKRTRT